MAGSLCDALFGHLAKNELKMTRCWLVLLEVHLPLLFLVFYKAGKLKLRIGEVLAVGKP